MRRMCYSSLIYIAFAAVDGNSRSRGDAKEMVMTMMKHKMKALVVLGVCLAAVALISCSRGNTNVENTRDTASENADGLIHICHANRITCLSLIRQHSFRIGTLQNFVLSK